MQGLLAIPAADLHAALVDACDLVARALGADKVDAFLYDPARESLVAVGTSSQPLSMKQRQVGLDVLPVANGGRVVWVFERGETFTTGRLDEDPEELRGVKQVLAIKSKIGVPINIGGRRRGMMMIASLRRHFFTDDDVRFAETVVQWVGTVVRRAELVREVAHNAVEQGRRAVAEELVTVLAHDLRNLIAPIGTRLELIRRRHAQDGSPDGRDAEAALRTFDRLGRIIGDLLDVARIDQGLFKIEVQPINVVAMVEEVARALSTPAHEVRVTASTDLVVLADGRRLKQCLENLFANAIQHSPAGAPVHVMVSNHDRGDGMCARLEIHDEGPGIPSDLLPRIFERFAAGSRSMGLGLGLYLANRIVAAHGGELTVQSAPGQGAHFALTLPCYDEMADEAWRRPRELH